MNFQSPGSIMFQLSPLTTQWYWILIAVGVILTGVLIYRLITRFKVDPEETMVGLVVGVVAIAFYFPFINHWRVEPFTARWYGLVIAAGFVSAAYFIGGLAKRWNLDAEKVSWGAMISFLGGIIGGRLYFVALGLSYFLARPAEILATWNGGMSIHGGIIGGFLTGAIYCKYAKLPIMRCMDLGSIVIPLAQAVGRWGNFFNSEAFGRPVPDDFPLKLFIPPECRPTAFADEKYFHPTFLYESVWDLMIFLFLYFYASKKLSNYPGLVFLIYLALYSIGRLSIEPLRTDSIMAGAIPVPIIASAATLAVSIVASLGLVWYYKKKPYKDDLESVTSDEAQQEVESKQTAD